MHKIEIPSKGQEFEFPECIAECTGEQFTLLADLNYRFLTGAITFIDLKVKLLYGLLGMERKVNLGKNDATAYRVAENVYRASELLETFYESKTNDGKTAKILKLDHVGNPLPSIALNGSYWRGPKAALGDISFGQYLAANDAFHDFYAYREDHYLDLLVAHLYWPKGEPHDPKKVDGRLELVKELPVGVKYGICLFFQACQNWIATQTALDIGGGHTVNLTVLFKRTESDGHATPGIGLKSTLYDLAETQVFGDLDSTASHNLYEILVFLVTKYHEAQKLKRNAKSK